MTIEPRNILTMSSEHYCKMTNINIANFYAIGVHVEMVNPQDLLKEFTLYVPNEAEVVTDFIIGGYGGGQGAYSRGYASGTALVPKGVTASTATLVDDG